MKNYIEVNRHGYVIDFQVANEQPEDTGETQWVETRWDHTCETCGGLFGLDANNSCNCGG